VIAEDASVVHGSPPLTARAGPPAGGLPVLGVPGSRSLCNS
jgi:hypothetical protein